jgi:hypothetical protein
MEPMKQRLMLDQIDVLKEEILLHMSLTDPRTMIPVEESYQMQLDLLQKIREGLEETW